MNFDFIFAKWRHVLVKLDFWLHRTSDENLFLYEKRIYAKFPIQFQRPMVGKFKTEHEISRLQISGRIFF
jgi:hypothetical protein